jgi:dTDP-4-dehydrorhamnose 3,5-epimerase
MKLIKTKIQGVFIIENNKFEDSRGFFTESYNYLLFKKFIKSKFIQDNISLSKKKFTFRGLHFQKKPFQQSKLIRVDQGAIIDFILDIRRFSKTYLKLIMIKLTEKDLKQIYIPKGCAHGFLTLAPKTKVFYKVDNYYSKSHDAGYNILDKKISLKKLNKNSFFLSKKDYNLPFLNEKIK